MKSPDFYKEIKEVKRWGNFLILFYKPMIPSQLSEITKENIKYVSFVLKKFVEKNIANCITPDAKTGRIYRLTEKGRRLRKRLIRENEHSGEMLEKANASYEFQELRADTDVNCYRYVIDSKDKREFTLKMRHLSRLRGFFTAPEILALYRRDAIEGKKVPRSELYKILKLFVNTGILDKFKIGGRNVGFKFTKKGWIVAEQI